MFQVELSVQDHFGATSWEPIGTIDEFALANAFEEEQMQDLLDLKPGQEYSGNEGAGGTWTIRRVPS